MEGAPGPIDVDAVRAALAAVDGVQDVHDLHVWTITSGFVALSAHVVVNASAEAPDVLRLASARLMERFDIRHATLQLDIAHFLQRDVALLPLNMFRREAAGRAAAPELLARLADGRLHLDVRSFALADAAVALEWIAQRGHRGRAVLVP